MARRSSSSVASPRSVCPAVSRMRAVGHTGGGRESVLCTAGASGVFRGWSVCVSTAGNVPLVFHRYEADGGDFLVERGFVGG